MIIFILLLLELLLLPYASVVQPIEGAVEHNERTEATAYDPRSLDRSMAQLAASRIFGMSRGTYAL
jgi:hypothetical protein